MFRKLVLPLCATALSSLIICAPAFAQEAQLESKTTVEAEVKPDENPAVAFLEQVEVKNKEMETLHGVFKQVRLNPMFLEEIESDGEFWYRKPHEFRCDYITPTPTQFFLIDREVKTYTPELKQVEKYTLPSGDQAPVHQMLVGFGLDTERIKDIFTIQMAPEQPEDEALLVIDFKSRDTDRSLGFESISITFDREALEPRKIFMVEESENTVTVNLEKVTINEELPEDLFDLVVPDDVEVVQY